MRVTRIIETSDRWLLPIVGGTVAQCCIDHAFTMHLATTEGSFSVRIEEPFFFRLSTGKSFFLRPEGEKVALGPALAMFGLSVGDAAAHKDGRFELSFSDGSSLQVPAGTDFEPWEFVGPSGLRVVSLPGGDIAVWLPESSRQQPNGDR